MKFLSRLSVFLIVALYTSYAYLFIYREVIPGFPPLYWYALTIGFAAIIAIIRLPSLLPKEYRHFIIWLLIYLSWTLITSFYSSYSAASEQILITTIEMVLLMFSFLVIFQLDNAVHVARLALLLAALFTVALNFMDFITPTWSKVPGRAAGFYENPTITGKMLVFMMVASITVVPRALRIHYIILVGLGALVTFTRSAWLLWALAVIGLAVSGCIVMSRKGTNLVVIGFSFATILIVYILLTGTMLDFITAIGLDDYLTPNTIERLGGSGKAFADPSTRSRAAAAAKSWAIFQEHPWFGAGLGYTREVYSGVAPHNLYLTIAAEGGLLGIAIFVHLLIALYIMGDSIGKLLTVVYAASSMTSHNNLDTPAVLLVITFIVASQRSLNRFPATSTKASQEIKILPHDLN